MSRACDLTGQCAMFGNCVSHSNHKTRRRFSVNLFTKKFDSTVIKKKIKVSSRTLRTIDKYGGLDSYLILTKRNKLTPFAKKMKNKLMAMINKD